MSDMIDGYKALHDHRKALRHAFRRPGRRGAPEARA